MLQLLLFVLPLGLDTLGISLSLGIKSPLTKPGERQPILPLWIRSALLFSLAETVMPLVGLALGYVASLALSNIMHFVGPLILVGIGVWELLEEALERLRKRNNQLKSLSQNIPVTPRSRVEVTGWKRQVILALSVSLDELAIGFSIGAVTVSSQGGQLANPSILSIFIGVQSFLMTVLGLTLGRMLRARLKPVEELSELLSAVLLIGLGVWLLLT